MERIKKKEKKDMTIGEGGGRGRLMRERNR